MRRLLVAGLLAASAIGAAAPVHAQAFVQPKGHGRVITSAIYSHSDRAFDDNARSTDIPDYDQYEVYFIGEYGVTDDLTLLLTPSLRDVEVRGVSGSRGLGYTDVGARYRVAGGGNYVISLQGLVRIPGMRWRDILAQVGQTDAEYEARAQGAVTFGKGSFVNLEGAYRLRAGDPPNDFHIDATLGVRATPRLLLLANSFNTISDGDGRGVFRRYRYHNVYASAAYDVSDRVTLQFGGLGTVAGRTALRERGLFAGAWLRF